MARTNNQPFDNNSKASEDAHLLPEQEKIHILCEEYEGESGIREFTILAVSRDKEALKKLMQAKIEKDEYGLIHQNGIEDDCENLFSCNFENGFVSYQIMEEEVLTNAMIQAKLNTPEYNPKFVYPATLDQALTPALNKVAEGYVNFDIPKALDHIKADKDFELIFKTSWWGECFDSVEGNLRNRIIFSLQAFVQQRLDENPNYFIDAGAATPYKLPENAKYLLINTIYDVSRDAQLHVQSAAAQAEQILRDGAFLKAFQNYGSEPIEFGSANYKEALWTCQKFVRSLLLNEPDQCLDTKVTEALLRQTRQVDGHQNDSTNKER